MQDCGNSSAIATELPQSYTHPHTIVQNRSTQIAQLINLIIQSYLIPDILYGLMQDCGNSGAIASELPQSYTHPHTIVLNWSTQIAQLIKLIIQSYLAPDILYG